MATPKGFEWTRDKSKCAQLIDGVMINNFDELWEHRFQQLVAYKGIISLQ